LNTAHPEGRVPTADTAVTRVQLEVTGSVGLDGELHIGATVALPPDRHEGPLLFCIPGGTYTREYYHPTETDLTDYSFLAALAARGFAVAAIDILGVGSSSKPADGMEITLETAAAANAAALGCLLDRLPRGTLPGLAKFDPTAILGVGHSLGGMLVIAQQALTPFAGVAVLGWSNQRIERHGAVMTPLADLVGEDGYVSIPRGGRRALFHLSDVPDAVIVEDETKMVAPVPGPLYETTLTPGVVKNRAAAIAVPVLLVFGELDTSPDPVAEVGTYPGSPDVTLFEMAGSAHCHNFAGSRAVLWDRLAGWARTAADAAAL
jgi:pimeloyl-ACP methyl ester carboxylesterase